METLLYLAKVNVCWILFYGCYWLFFRKHTFFQWNRLYLLVSLLASFAVPLITFSEQTVAVAPLAQVIQVPDLMTYPETTIVFSGEETTSFDWTQLLYVVYLAGAAILFLQLAKGLFAIRNLLRKNEQLAFDDYTLILLPLSTYQQGSFSFFRWLMVSQQDYEENLDTVLRHELVHIRQKHSYDIILIELLKVVFWFNPVLWLYKKSLQEVHEFLADEEVPNRERYATFLIGYGMHSPVQSLTNQFFSSSLLKSRIKMIYKNRTSRWLLGKYLMILPVLLLVVSLTAAREHMMIEAESVSKPEMLIEEAKNVPQQIAEPIIETVETPVKADETIDIKGQIVNKNGLSVGNATIIIKNTKIGVSADHSGRFKLDKVPINSTLVASHVSYQSAEFEVKKTQAQYKITLQSAENVYGEVVVVTYPTVKNRTGNSNESLGSTKKDVIVEQKAEYPGGVEEMMKYIGRNVKYPTKAANINISGTVIISFVVNEYGHIQKTEIIKGIGYGLDQEATRVVWSMPKWSPAIQNGEAVASWHTLPIKFEIDQSQADKDKRQGFMNYPKSEDIKLAKANLKEFKFDDKKAIPAPSNHVTLHTGSDNTFMNYKIAEPASNYRYFKVAYTK
ncbi:hypothetical protein DSL64_27085 [Dyadobacter luteus]|uniref:TonB C-terminal domain-containing protein n=1 Tax=Dyadobacter luteus TaxID=2259619 RepID=A0A3D8Y330_9BACT|nr:TonB family protein [Dyadobacter luteus]REA56362.1 hypothetical protein DSL64_27085 [Dyadobacter luteus]